MLQRDFPGLSADQLAQGLAQRAFVQRDELAALLGMAPVLGRVRPPVRLGDGRLGYPLSGRGESSTEALRQAIRRLFPRLTDAQVEDFIAAWQPPFCAGCRANTWPSTRRLSGSCTSN